MVCLIQFGQGSLWIDLQCVQLNWIMFTLSSLFVYWYMKLKISHRYFSIKFSIWYSKEKYSTFLELLRAVKNYMYVSFIDKPWIKGILTEI